jgi:hypothetical protein
MEIIAICDERVDDVSTLGQEFPFVEFHCTSGLQTQERLRAIGVGHSRGKIVALTVDHCTPEEHWCRQLMKAHSRDYAGVGGAFEKGIQPGTAINWAVHFYDYCNYGYYQNPVPPGPARALSDGNVSYKREALDRVADLWNESFHVPFVNRALLNRGEGLWLAPDIVVYQNRNIDFSRAIQVAYRRGRVFASTRISKSIQVKRVFYAFFSFLLPLVLLGRLAANTIYKRAQLLPLLKAFPLIALLTMLWACGEFMGYVTGREWSKPGDTYD